MDKVGTLNTHELHGRQLYQHSDYYRQLCNIMEHPEFRSFFDKYVKDWDDARLIISFMKLYESIEKHSSVDLSPYQKLAILKQTVDNADFRRNLCNSILDANKQLSIQN